MSNTADPDIIQEGDNIVIRMHDDKSALLVKVAPDQKIGKTRLSLRSLAGSPYGSIFELRNRTPERVVDEEVDFDDVDMTMDDNNDKINSNTTEAGDNRNYNDTNNAQKYDNVAIEKLKDAGTSGKDIIKTLITNSDTWNSKTEFAQAKWLKRKTKKYIKRFRVVKASPTSICEVYYAKSKDKICGMRWDVMAQLLSQSGIQANSRVIVVDTMVGLMLGAVAYRLRGFGRIMAVYAGNQPHFELVSALNLDIKSLSIIQVNYNIFIN
jgi:tRNA (adenine-N(1)-)-methyltransferase non-catalytic subunit